MLREQIDPRYRTDVARYPALPRKETDALFAAKALGGAGWEEARRKLYVHNLRLVTVIATGPRYAGKGVDLDDLIAEGNIALGRAVDGFEPEQGFRFSTYAIRCIKVGLLGAIDNHGSSVKVPHHAGYFLSRFRRARAGMACGDASGCEPTVPEVIAAMGLPPYKATIIEDAIRAGTARGWGCHAAMRTGVGGDEREFEPNSAFAGEEESPWESLDRDESLAAMSGAMLGLNDRQRAVLEMRYGLGGVERKTLVETGKTLGLCKQRIEQIQNEAIAILRSMMGVSMV